MSFTRSQATRSDMEESYEARRLGSRDPRFPRGRYLSATGIARPNTGGQTRAMLMRSRVLGAATGQPVDVLSFDPSRRYDAIRAELRSQKLLSGGMRLLNIFEHYREAGWGDEAGSVEPLERLDRLETVEVAHPDGSPWQTSYLDPASGEAVMNDFRRSDGSVYLRVAPYRTLSAEALPGTLIMVGPDGRVVGRFDGLTPWYHRWLKDLTVDDDETFLFIDSRFLLPLVVPLEDPTIRSIYVLHNCHVPAPRRWDTPSRPAYRRACEKIEDVDAFVTLTDRQRSDIELRWGRRNNTSVVANPVERPEEPVPPVPRSPHLVVLVARLEKQKRIADAIAAMELVVAEIPDARLDIYGSGSRMEELQELIERRGLSRSVILRGYDPDAPQALWSGSAFLLTSEFEGYPLVVLESLSRGCPVVSYDVPYGPREQISDGVDGFLVPDGDTSAAAQRVVSLLSSPELVERLGTAGRAKARLHEQDAFLADWASVLRGVVTRAPERTRLTAVDANIDVTSPSWLSRWRRRQSLTLSGQLRITADTGANPATLQVGLEAVSESTGEVTALVISAAQELGAGFPAAVGHHGERLVEVRVTAVVDEHRVFAAMPHASRATLRLSVSWQNAYWETLVKTQGAVTEAKATAAETLTLRRPTRPR